MKDGTVSNKNTLQSMLLTKHLILEDIYDSFGEIDEGQEKQLLDLDVNIPHKIDGWAWTLMKNGGIDKEIELLKDKKKQIEEMIQKLERGKDDRKTYVNNILSQNGLERIDGNDYWIKSDVNVSRNVIISKVEDHFKTYQLPKLSYQEYELLIGVFTYLTDNVESISPDDLTRAINLLVKFREEKVESCGVKDLPKDHPSIEAVNKPTVRIYPLKRAQKRKVA